MEVQLASPSNLYPNVTNYEAVKNSLQQASDQLSAPGILPQDRARLLTYLRTLNDWLHYANFSPSLLALRNISFPVIQKREPVHNFSFHTTKFPLDGDVEPRRFLRFGTDEVYIEKRVITKTILGEVCEYILSRIDPGGNIAVIQPYHRFAIKTFFPNHRKNTQENMLRELTYQERLTETRSPYILPLLQHGDCEGCVFAVFPLIHRGDLFDAISRGLSIQETKRVLRTLIEGIQVMHKLGLCHRDVSPENVLVTDDMDALVMDFGLAMQMEEDWQVPYRGFVGKKAYAAPEIIAGGIQSYDGRKADIWSFGLIVFAAVVHSLPWVTASNADPVFRRAMNQMEKFLLFVIPEPSDALLRDLLLKVLRHNPSERPTADELREHPWLQ